jgi:putative ABC transport system permease protein
MTLGLLIWKNLWRRRTRSLLTVAGVAVGVASGVAMAGIAKGYEQSLARVYAARGADLIITRLSNHKRVPTTYFEQARASDIAALPGVQAVAGVVWVMLNVEEESIPVLVEGWEPGSFLWDHLKLRAGSVTNGPGDADCIYLGVMCAEMLKKKVGDTVRMESRALRVAGIFESNSMFENGSTLLPLPLLQSILGNEGKINFLNVRLAPEITAGQVDKLRQTIQGRFRGLKAFQAEEIAQNSIGLQAAKAMCLAATSIALLIGALGMMNTLLMSVFERTSEIGLLMAVGWRRRRVVAMILLESVILSLAGAAGGVLTGIIGVRIMQTMGFMQGRIAGEFSLGLIGTAFAVAALLGMLGGIYPAARAASMSPSAALRSE